MVEEITVGAALRRLTHYLEENGIEAPDFEALQMLQSLGYSKIQILEGRGVLTQQQQEQLRQLASRRLEGEPLQYLLGEWEFYGLTLKVGPGVLIPRPDTETLVEAGLSYLKGRTGCRVLDLCAGTGCVGLAVEQNAKNISALYALEKEEAAFFYLKENLAAYESRIMPLHQDGLAPGPEADKLDVILCNPPYLTGEDMESLQTEVRYEPPSALDGGEDGLDFYRRLTAVWKDRLVSGGLLAYEIGMGQQEDVSRILIREGLEQIHWKEDLSGIVRVVAGRKPMQ
ncbi:MAG TPA: peptide chain release factor N(5)-glutamine methyltransferase [Candidatus Egerieicola faecale]|uniref:peptide chain release factor N(5)-glutamine methyltransferase n=1 Tax=Candidatus Egerieicola faecale TaxID=2840774 RepID=A0A9D1LK56_9FIRM|nr:peptide chain release factor N(5)-glutamine methyltransferase [Candidatus Egerieicola faecale]